MGEKTDFKKAKSTGKSSRVMSLSVVAAMLDVSRNQVMVWIRDGLVPEKEPSKKGESYELDIADVVNWRIAREKERVVELMTKGVAGASIGTTPSSGPEGESKEDADRRRAIALANISEVEEAEAIGAVAPIVAMETMVRTDYAKVRQGLEGVGAEIADRTASLTDPAEIREIVDDIIRDKAEHLVWRMPGTDAAADDDE